MKVLFVVPKLCAPWSEGRKKFVCDLIAASRDRWEVSILASHDELEEAAAFGDIPLMSLSSRYSFQHLTQLYWNLGRAIDRYQPELVCYFPFGAFGGIRSIANLLFIQQFSRVCQHRGLIDMTLMYSLTQEAASSWHTRVLEKTYRNQYSDHGRTIRFGVSLPAIPQMTNSGAAVVKEMNAPKRLLFMAGMAECNVERLDYAVAIRGLGLLLESGADLASRGFQLTVAIPLLRDKALLQRLKAAALDWGESISFLAIATTPDIYREHDVFVFPYAREEMQFVPTSVVEAMHSGLPVLMPRLEFLRPFHSQEGVVASYEPGSAADLLKELERLLSSPQSYQAMVERGRTFIDFEYDIRASVEDIEAAWEQRKLSSPSS